MWTKESAGFIYGSSTVSVAINQKTQLCVAAYHHRRALIGPRIRWLWVNTTKIPDRTLMHLMNNTSSCGKYVSKQVCCRAIHRINYHARAQLLNNRHINLIKQRTFIRRHNICCGKSSTLICWLKRRCGFHALKKNARNRTSISSANNHAAIFAGKLSCRNNEATSYIFMMCTGPANRWSWAKSLGHTHV